METNMFRVFQYLWGAGKLKIPYACRSSLRSTMKKFKSRQKRNTRNSSLMPRPWKCWNLRYCLQCCGFDPPGNTCLQPQRFVFPFRKSSASHCLRSCLSYLVCWSQLTLLKLQPCLLQQGKLPGWSNTRSKTVKLQLISKKETWGKKINQKKKKQQNVKEKRTGEGPEQLCGTVKEASRNYHLLHGENESCKEGILPAVNDYRRLRHYL